MLRIVTDENAVEHVFPITRLEFAKVAKDCTIEVADESFMYFDHKDAMYVDLTYNEYKHKMEATAWINRDQWEHVYHGHVI